MSLPPNQRKKAWHGVSVGFVVGAMAAGLLCFCPLIGWLIDRWGRKPVLSMGLSLMLAIVPLYVLLLGGIGCGVSLIALRQFGQPIVVSQSIE